MIMHTQTLMEDVRLQFMTDFQVFIGKGRLKGGKKRASLFHVPIQLCSSSSGAAYNAGTMMTRYLAKSADVDSGQRKSHSMFIS